MKNSIGDLNGRARSVRSRWFILGGNFDDS
jgi:hypothetical protein